MKSALAILALLALAACDDELPRTGALGGQVVRLEDGVGYGPVAVAIYEMDSLRAVASTVTDEDGRFWVGRLKPGLYTPVVYDEKRVVFHLERPRYDVQRGTTVRARIPMTAADFYTDTGVFLEGTILDAEDDSPISLAVVEVADIENATDVPFWSFSEIDGRGGPLVSVTDATGHYRIGPMPIVPNPMTGDLTVPHVRIHHPLYVDAGIGPWDRFQIPAVRNVRLRRGEDTGVIHGELRYLLYEGSRLTQPAAGIRVALEWQGMGSLFPKLLMSPPSSVSDAEGKFEIRGLPPGRYVLLPAYLPDDGFVGETKRIVAITVPGAEVTVSAPLAVAPAIRLLSPADDAVEPEPVLFDWEDVPGATEYIFLLTRGEDLWRFEFGTGDESQYVVDGDAREFLSRGRTFRWGVTAFNEDGELSASERSYFLRLSSDL